MLDKHFFVHTNVFKVSTCQISSCCFFAQDCRQSFAQREIVQFLSEENMSTRFPGVAAERKDTMPSVSTDVLTRFNFPSIVHGLAGYYSANDQKRHAIVAMPDGAVIEVYW